MPFSANNLPIGQGGNGVLVATGTFSVVGGTQLISVPAIAGRSCRLEVDGATAGTLAGSYAACGLNSAHALQVSKRTIINTTASIINAVSSMVPIADTITSNHSEVSAVINYKSYQEGVSIAHKVESMACDKDFYFQGMGSNGSSGLANQLSFIAPTGVTFAGTYRLYI